MKIYTKKGDSGETGLLGGTRVPKYDLRIEAYGTVDELNSHIGYMSTFPSLNKHIPLLRGIQDRLFTLGSHLANDPSKSAFKLPDFSPEGIEVLETSIDEMEEHLPPLTNFVLPGGHPANAQAHIARCVCRRAERRVVELASNVDVDANIVRYLNRLSDWLFVLARKASSETGSEEIVWKST
ncbi:MAG: cob(I)yrinic acid a,c-diamide adenosyltransferase [Bacteroidia bacterium]